MKKAETRSLLYIKEGLRLLTTKNTPERIRTPDAWLRTPSLYPLSYRCMLSLIAKTIVQQNHGFGKGKIKNFKKTLSGLQLVYCFREHGRNLEEVAINFNSHVAPLKLHDAFGDCESKPGSLGIARLVAAFKAFKYLVR